MIDYKNDKMNNISELKIGNGIEKKRLEINLGWKKINIIIRW